MSELIESGKMTELLEWAYQKAVDGASSVGIDSAEKLAEDYLKEDGELVDKINSLIRWQNTKAATSGFVTGLGGLITMPLTLPANITSVAFVQIRMIAAIAHMCGHDLKSDQVKTLVFLCLTGNAAMDVLKDVGIAVGRKLSESAIKSISGATIRKINQAVGIRLLTKAGQTGAINLSKAIPLIGGIVGATFDSVSTNTVGNVARDCFIGKPVRAVAEAI